MTKTSGGSRILCRLAASLAASLAACSSAVPGPDGELPSPSVACANRPLTQLSAGQHVILDPAATSGCLRLPANGGSGASYLLVLASTNGTKTSTGFQGSYLLRSSTPLASTTASAASAAAAAVRAPAAGLAGNLAAQFDATLRRREAELAAEPRKRPEPVTAQVAAAPPPLGDVKSFKTCGNLTCSSFVTVQATARFVGEHAAIYLDNDVPQNDSLQTSDFTNLGSSFDTFHFPIDTTAFGRESDQDANGVVIILMTDAVNALTPNCNNGRVIGYFYGGDLLPGSNSNRAEVFYTLVPAPATPDCTAVSRAQAVDNLKPTLIHEFQHMISFNQHALLRGGNAEEVWLNEALSHFAEELGGRLIPDVLCVRFPSCRSQYASGDLINSYNYLESPESHYLFIPTSSTGTLEERGAGWLFLRWTLDQFSPDSIRGTPTTRALLATSQTGIANLTAVTGGNGASMVPEWLMAAYLDDGPDLPFESSGRLRFKSWGLRAIWTNPANQNTATPPGPFQGFPLTPDTITASFSLSGTLKAGTGHHFLIAQPAGGAAIDIQVLKSTAGAQLDASLQSRFGLVRIR